jgi:hypothetical protein
MVNTKIQIVQFGFFLLLITSFVGCKSIGTVQIEVMKPAEIVLPATINKLLLINNWSTQQTGLTNPNQKNKYQLDTLTTQNIIQNLGVYLAESPRLDSAQFLNQMIYRQAKDLFKPIVWDDVNRLCQASQTDALLSLEAFGMVDSLVRMTYFDGISYTSYTNLKLLVSSMWRIYDAENQQVFLKWWQHDTLYFSNIENINQYYHVIESEKGKAWLANSIAEKVALKTSDKLAPYWLTENRYYFNIYTDEMMKAAGLAQRDKWIEAARIWQIMSKNKHTYIASAACHNMALVCEVQGRLDIAVVWLEKSLTKQYNQISYDYMKLLKKRLNEEEILDKQFGF